MSTISIRDLQRNTSSVIADVADSKHTALVTRHGEPIAALVPIDARISRTTCSQRSRASPRTWPPPIRLMQMAKRAQLLRCSRSWTHKTLGNSAYAQEAGSL